MNLREALLNEHSRNQTQKIVRAIGRDQKLFDQLVKLVLEKNGIISNRAAWVLGYSGITNKDYFLKYLSQLLELLNEKNVHNSLKRNIVRVLQYLDLPDDFCAEAFDTCIKLVLNNNEAIAVRAFSISILQNLIKKYPDFKEELKLSLQQILPNASAGLKSKCKRTLLEL